MDTHSLDFLHGSCPALYVVTLSDVAHSEGLDASNVSTGVVATSRGDEASRRGRDPRRLEAPLPCLFRQGRGAQYARAQSDGRNRTAVRAERLSRWKNRYASVLDAIS